MLSDYLKPKNKREPSKSYESDLDADLQNFKFDKDFGVKGKTTGKKSWDNNYEKDFGVKGKTTGKKSWEDSKPKSKAKPSKVSSDSSSSESTSSDVTPTGNIGSVDTTPEVINSAPDMARTNIPAPVIDDSSQAVKPFRNTDPSKVVDKDRSTWIDPQIQAQRSLGFKKGGFVHAKDTMSKHSGGFKHHSDMNSKHSAGFKPHHEHVKAMCGGGKVKK
jgi:hypothetical protein